MYFPEGTDIYIVSASSFDCYGRLVIFINGIMFTVFHQPQVSNINITTIDHSTAAISPLQKRERTGKVYASDIQISPKIERLYGLAGQGTKL